MAFEIEGRPEPAAMRPADISSAAGEDNKTVGEITAAPHIDADGMSLQKGVVAETNLGDRGAQRIEIIQKIWGKHGQLLLELDNTTFGTYYVYALSDFNKVASSSALAVATDLSFSLTKPIWAKFSDIFGRGEMYPVATLFVVIGYILAASANGFSAFAAGTILRAVGLTGINSLNTIIIADTTTARQRGFGVNFQFFPYLVLPWIAAEIISSVMSPGGIGWKWGVGIIGIIFPFAMIPIIAVTFIFARRAKKIEASLAEEAATHGAAIDDATVAAVAAASPEGTADESKRKVTAYSIASNIDLGGLLIMIISLAFILIPLSLASLQTQGYRTPWVIALIVIGGIGLLVGFPLYEHFVATHPIFPLRYVRHRAIGLAFLLYFTDYMAASVSHGYLYNWAIIAQNLTIVQATDLSYINGVFTFFSGMAFGFVMWKTRSFKWWLIFGLVIRIIGYGVMFRIRTEHPSLAELIIVQIVQGLGDGIVQTGGYIAATINVPHKETAQAVALIVTIGMLGSSVGSAISGAIYTSTFPNELRHYLGDLATPELISDIINSIDSNVPAWGTVARTGIANAYNQVTSYFFIAAMVIIAPGFIMVYFLPNQKLNDNQNLLEDHGMLAAQQAEVELHPNAQSPTADTKA
ncbi:hypothetical protein SEUCBS140593_008493 [Sporothrix eucalyptigena]|uniref:Major facilitator superfamily (MFS) profile domain-containing protein n=1 Tax=Sporothrix eucalyptigena TaxID=1812306 RepID=A0ABP0CLZ0_9PEZI